jgi:hypothetical protein
MKTSEIILNETWLRQCLDRFPYDDTLFTFVIEWKNAAWKYLCWLEEEGFTKKEALRIIDDALTKADFDLSKFPMCPL